MSVNCRHGRIPLSPTAGAEIGSHGRRVGSVILTITIPTLPGDVPEETSSGSSPASSLRTGVRSPGHHGWPGLFDWLNPLGWTVLNLTRFLFVLLVNGGSPCHPRVERFHYFLTGK